MSESRLPTGRVADVGRRVKRKKKQPPRWPRQLNFAGYDPLSGEPGYSPSARKGNDPRLSVEGQIAMRRGSSVRGGGTFRDILIRQAREVEELERLTHVLREAGIPDLQLAPMEELLADLRSSPAHTSKRRNELLARFYDHLDAVGEVIKARAGRV